MAKEQKAYLIQDSTGESLVWVAESIPKAIDLSWQAWVAKFDDNVALDEVEERAFYESELQSVTLLGDVGGIQ